MTITYHNEVMRAGNRKPWESWPRLSHKDVIAPSDVELDREGNILKMPVLHRKPCFGRPETFIRHGDRVRLAKNHYGKMVQSTSHQCGSCPLLTWQSCGKVVVRRVQGNTALHVAYGLWVEDCRVRHGGTPTFTGESGKPWGNFKKAIAARGPFSNDNERVLAIANAALAEIKRKKWQAAKAVQRQRARESKKADRQAPSLQFVENVRDECDRRRRQLEMVLGDPKQHPSRSRVPAAKRPTTAAITANAWGVRELLRECCLPDGSGVIARKMVEHGLNEGLRLPTLKARLPADLERGAQCERDGIWESFDPDSDLLAYDKPDDVAADTQEHSAGVIDDILKGHIRMP